MDNISTRRIQNLKEIEMNSTDITFEEFIAVVKFHARIHMSETYKKNIQVARNLIEKFSEEGQAIYGVTTGFGDNVKYIISPRETVLLQQNILRSHACSVGVPLLEEEVRAIILMIITNTGKGFSGVRLETIQLLCDVLNHDLYPFAPGEGSVGYLSVEAHICLTLIGEGYFIQGGNKIPSIQVLQSKQLTPLILGCKEGLSLISGTTSVTALSLLSLYYGIVAQKNIQIASALAFEALRGTTKALDAVVHNLKHHHSQRVIASNMRSLLKDSQICLTYRNEKVQDPCLLRTIPQVLGSSMLLIHESFVTIMNELQSVSDNPVILPNEDVSEQVYMTGNFDGSFIGTHCDMLSIAYANLGNFVERCTDRLINHHLSNGLPPFLITNPGLNNGFMIPQYTQAALQNELKLLAVPASVDSITTCAGQEDPVSMAYHAAYKSNRSAKKLIQMTSILIMTAVQALDLTIRSTQLQPSPLSMKILEMIRPLVPFVNEDRYIYKDIEIFQEFINLNQLVDIVESELNIIL